MLAFHNSNKWSETKTLAYIACDVASLALANKRNPDFKPGTDYCRNDVRRFLTPDERKALSVRVRREINQNKRFIKPSHYRFVCRQIGINVGL